MINKVSYNINTIDGPRHITITPDNRPLPGGDFYATGIFTLREGAVGMGEIIFDEDMNEWEYNGIDALTYVEAAEIAEFIKKYKDPEGADPNLLQ